MFEPRASGEKPKKTASLAIPDHIDAVLADPAASRWLKTALGHALTRDPVDAADDAEMLAALLCDCADRALSRRLADLLRERVERQFAASLSEHKQA